MLWMILPCVLCHSCGGHCCVQILPAEDHALGAEEGIHSGTEAGREESVCGQRMQEFSNGQLQATGGD